MCAFRILRCRPVVTSIFGNKGGRNIGSIHAGKLQHSRKRPRPPEEVQLQIHELSNEGTGVGYIGQRAVHVPFVLPGELVKARIFKNMEHYSMADLVEVLRPSAERIKAPCQYFGTCNGCQLQHMSIDAQRRWKRDVIVRLFQGLVDAPSLVRPVVGTADVYHYRSKITPHYMRHSSQLGVPPIGYQRIDNRGNVDVERCIIAKDDINERYASLRHEIQSLGQTALNRRTSVGLILRSTEGGVCISNNEMVSTVVCGIRYKFRAGDFFQPNEIALPLMIDHVEREVLATPATITHLVDAYCGVGLFALALARRMQTVKGIEISSTAVRAARENAQANGVANCEFEVGTASDIFAGVGHFPRGNTAVIVDPPRTGCDEAFIRQLLRFQPRRIIYIACAPSTQARDTQLLLKLSRDLVPVAAAQYKITCIQPFDMFPQTKHIENVITFELC